MKRLEKGSRATPFGTLLRHWRRTLGISQLALASTSATTPRHVSFLETGRSRPSHDMVLRLGEALGLPLRERNRLLEAAGLAPAYRAESLTAPDLAPFRAAIDRLLSAHEPYPAMVVDGRWNVILANPACLALFGRDLIGANLVRRYYGDQSVRAAIVNWPDVARSGLARLRRQLARSPFDDELRALVDLAEAAVAELGEHRDGPNQDLVVCPHFRVGRQVVRTIGMAAVFDTALEVALEELRIELIYPADADAQEFFQTRAGPGTGPGAGAHPQGDHPPAFGECARTATIEGEVADAVLRPLLW